MASKKAPKIDFAQVQANLQRQFQNLDPKDPSLWPALPRVLLLIGLAVGVAALLWFAKLSEFEDELNNERTTEETLRQDYQKKMIKAVSLDELKKQREQIQLYVTQLERQLPSKSEMSALLSDVNQAGLGRSLQFELFRPGAEQVKNYYAELPVAIRVTGKYHDIGDFAADVAKLPRIVTLSNFSIAPANKDVAGTLTMETTARTFRYLDPQELQQQEDAAKAAKGNK